MDSTEREFFWKTLVSLPGIDVQTESQKLLKTIRLPKYLYRYRPVTTQNLEALRTNRLYFSSANYFDDPFDTFLHINIDAIKNEYMSAFETRESTEQVVEGIKLLFSKKYSGEELSQITADKLQQELANGLVDRFLISTLALRDEIKKDTWSVCFSENGYNEVLWLKYADQHKGFVLIYDLENNENFLCGKQEKCHNCGIAMYGTPLYPIYYSDIPYDATNFSKLVVLRKLRELLGIEIPPELYKGMINGIWEQERITLIKKECHKYDEEWRMIANCGTNAPVLREWIPWGIILGLRMNQVEENLVISMAKEAGIKKIYKSYIDSQNRLNAIEVNIIK